MSRERKRLILAAAIIFTVNIFIIALAQSAAADLYKKGSTGDVVAEMQSRLKKWGYYFGVVDGVYGSKTEEAVRFFQRKNGLSVDGQVGNQTLAALGISPQSGKVSAMQDQSGDLYLLARLISAEARGEPYVGQVAVGAVVLNRVEHPSFPNTVSAVIYQPGAFSCLDDGQFDQPISESAWRAAQEAIDGSDPSSGAIYYFNPATATSKWIWSRPLIVQIGNHRFCS